MKRVLIAYSKDNKLKEIVEGLKLGFEFNDIKVDLETIPTNSPAVYFSKYDLVLIGSPNLGLFGGNLDPKVDMFLQNIKRAVGQEVIAFVQERFFGRSKALKTLMGKLESEGCIVKDFRELKDKESAKRYAKGFRL
ncbi:hypothetical protein [Orenia marismortui]|uniref:Flavodoxin n=1 Tax=Orenia marismortui TaxID=46469 RepID=A0A4R8HG34_9FIRM|nr:hypothetical protein [Orenia marismortui]TDX59140.1 hypothetical protein C7959_10126 [Orenia marismortui]